VKEREREREGGGREGGRENVSSGVDLHFNQPTSNVVNLYKELVKFLHSLESITRGYQTLSW
jgi:hypothetical protein